MNFKLFMENELSKNWMNKENKYSWLDPQGIFYPIKGSVNHLLKAKNLINMPSHLALNKLFSQGWGRITFMGKVLYFNNPKFPSSKHQKKNLIDYAISDGFSEIVVDNDVDDVIMWQRD